MTTGDPSMLDLCTCGHSRGAHADRPYDNGYTRDVKIVPCREAFNGTDCLCSGFVLAGGQPPTMLLLLERIAVALEKIAGGMANESAPSAPLDVATVMAIDRSNASACAHCGHRRDLHYLCPGAKIHTGACQAPECNVNCGMFI